MAQRDERHLHPLRQLLPVPLDGIDPVAAHAAAERPAPPDRPWVLVNMVAGVDGATAVSGSSGDLGGEADRVTFSAIRAVADVILAAAGTVRADGYGPPRTPAARRAERVARGQQPYPRIGVVTRSLDLDLASPLFTDSPTRPLVFTGTGAPAERVAAAEAVAEVVRSPGPDVSPAAIVRHLHDLGARTVLVEGGPSLNGAFADADLVDELDLTLAPELVGGDSARLLRGAGELRHPLRLAHLWEADGVLLARYVRARPPGR